MLSIKFYSLIIFITVIMMVQATTITTTTTPSSKIISKKSIIALDKHSVKNDQSSSSSLSTESITVNACLQPKRIGLCNEKLLRYAYNNLTGHCISFFYSGCGATLNNFLTYEECRRDCMRMDRY